MTIPPGTTTHDQCGAPKSAAHRVLYVTEAMRRAAYEASEPNGDFPWEGLSRDEREVWDRVVGAALTAGPNDIAMALYDGFSVGILRRPWPDCYEWASVVARDYSLGQPLPPPPLHPLPFGDEASVPDGPLGDQDGRVSTPGMSKTYASPLPQGPPDPTILAIVRSGEHPNTTGDFEGDD